MSKQPCIRNLIRLALLALLIVPSSCASSSRLGSAVPLGERVVDFAGDRDRIRVGAEYGQFRALRFHVSDSPLEMFDLEVRFGDGSSWSPGTASRFDRGSWSRRFDFPGHSRVVRSVEFRYRSLQVRSGRARVQVLGVR